MAISTQVLAEFAAVMLHKVFPPASTDAVMETLDALGPLRLIVPDGELVRRAIEAHLTYGLHFYDGMIVAAAERAGCARIWSEDLNGTEIFWHHSYQPIQLTEGATGVPARRHEKRTLTATISSCMIHRNIPLRTDVSRLCC